MKLDPIRKQRASELKQMRLEKGINRVELAALSGLSRTTIIRIETGSIGWNVDSEIIYFQTILNYVKT